MRHGVGEGAVHTTVRCAGTINASVGTHARTGPLQVQWIHDRSAAHAQSVCPWDGCDPVGTKWDQLTADNSEWGSPLEQEIRYQQRAMPVVGVPVEPGEGITGVPVPRSPGASVQR